MNKLYSIEEAAAMINAAIASLKEPVRSTTLASSTLQWAKEKLADTMRENERLQIMVKSYQEALDGKYDADYLKRYKDREITPEELNHLAGNNAFIQSLKRTKI